MSTFLKAKRRHLAADVSVVICMSDKMAMLLEKVIVVIEIQA